MKDGDKMVAEINSKDTTQVLCGTPNTGAPDLGATFDPVTSAMRNNGCRVGVLAYCTDLAGEFGAQNTVDTLVTDGRFSSVTLIDGDVVLPDAQFLLDNFDAVIAMTDNRCGFTIPQFIADSAADALAGFASNGGGVVLSAFGFSPTIGFGNSIFGPALSPFQKAGAGNAPAGTVDLTNISPAPGCQCPLSGVSSPLSSVFANFVALSEGASLCASYSNGTPFLAVNAAGNIIGLNTFPADASDNTQSSYRQLIGNVVFCVCKEKAARGIMFF